MVGRLLARRKAAVAAERDLARYVRSAIRAATPPAVIPWQPGRDRLLQLHGIAQVHPLDQPVYPNPITHHPRTHQDPQP